MRVGVPVLVEVLDELDGEIRSPRYDFRVVVSVEERVFFRNAKSVIPGALQLDHNP